MHVRLHKCAQQIMALDVVLFRQREAFSAQLVQSPIHDILAVLEHLGSGTFKGVQAFFPTSSASARLCWRCGNREGGND